MSGMPDQSAASERPLIAIDPQLPGLSDDIKQDLPIYLVVGTYALAGWVLALRLNDIDKYKPFQYLPGWIVLSAVVLFVIWFAQAIWRNPSRPLTGFCALARRHWNRGLVRRLPLVAAMGTFYGTFTSVKNMLPIIHPFTWDPMLATVDHWLFWGHDGWRVIASVIPDGLPLQIVDILYARVWIVLVLGFSAYVSIAADFPHHRRFLLSLFLSWIIAGNVLACLFMSGGPCFYAEFTQDHQRFADLLNSIAATRSAVEQKYLWQAYISNRSFLGAGISAFPSIHMVSIAIIAMSLKDMDRRFIWAGFILTFLMELGSIRLGWHYASDGLVGIAIAVALWYLVRFMERRAAA